MNDFEEIKKYLPKYLSPEATESLFQELREFTDKPHDRLYSAILAGDEGILQGDGLSLMPISNLPDHKVEDGPVMVLSNTCDIDKENKRHTPPRITYCPIIKLSRFIESLEKKSIAKEAIDQTVETIRLQRSSSIIFLPKGGHLPEDCLALLDRATNCDFRSAPQVKDSPNRLFSLSDFGWYLFLFKISLHFTRMQEAINRT